MRNGKSECRSVMERIRIEPTLRVDVDNIIRRESGQNLQHVEHAFRDLKSDNICIRPVYHRDEAQTRGHVQICVFAYAVIHEMEKKIYPFLKTWNKENNSQLSFNDIIAEMNNVKLCKLEIMSNYFL
jgi:transposase